MYRASVDSRFPDYGKVILLSFPRYKNDYIQQRYDDVVSEKEIWLEDESQRIGTVNIPQILWNHIRTCPVYFLDIPFEERLNYLVETYGKLDAIELGEAIKRIQKRLGGLETKLALQYLGEGNLKDCFSILLKYYDKQYSKGLENRPDPKPVVVKVETGVVNDIKNAALLLNY